jgi:peptide/nickel transport system substrate-binding protein
VLAAFFATVVAGGATASVDLKAATASPLVVNAPFGPATLDLAANACGAHDHWGINFYSQLTRWGSKPGSKTDAFGRPFSGGLVMSQMDENRLVPYVANSWTQSKDGRAFTLRLNPNARFNDGTRITAQAVKFSYERAVARKSCGATYWAGGISVPPNPATVTTPNARTVVIRFAYRGAPYLAGFAQAPASIFSPAQVAKHPDQEGVTVNPYWASNIAGGGGPFLLDRYEPNRLMTMRRNPRFLGPKPLSERVTVNFLSQEALLLQARSGRADITYGLSPRSVLSLRNNRNVNIIEVPNHYEWSINLNWKFPPLNDKRFREALTYAIPYQDILDEVQLGFGKLYYGPITHKLRFFNPKVSPPRSFNLARAKMLIAQTGVKTPLDMQMVVQQGSGVPEQVATILQSIWGQLGIKLNVTALSPAEYAATVGAKKAQMSIRAGGAGTPYANWQLDYDMRCGSPFNLSDICIPAAEKLLDQAEASTDPAVQQRLYDRIVQLWRAESPRIVLFGWHDLVVVNKRVKQYTWYSRPGVGLDRVRK